MAKRLGTSDLARALGVSRTTVYQYKDEGKITPGPDRKYDLGTVRQQLASTIGTKRGGLPRRGEAAATKVIPAQVQGPENKPGAEPQSRGRLEGIQKTDLEKASLKERIRRLKLDNDAREHRLVDRLQVEAQVERRFHEEKESLLGWPARVSPLMAADLNLDNATLYGVLNRYIRDYLRERSSHHASE